METGQVGRLASVAKPWPALTCAAKESRTNVINSELNLAHWRDELVRHGRAQIDHFLQPDAAALLRQCLTEQVPWTLAYREDSQSRVLGHGELAALGAAGEQALLQRCYAHARGEYAFTYESYMMVRAYKEGRDPGLLLHRVLEFLNSPEYLTFVRALTGEPRIRRMNAQATRFRPGHFLKRHDDFDAEEGRLYAYVINLSQNWQADWGGLLQFMDDAGRVTATLMPRWNTLSLFRVPASHAVSMVAPWATEPRLAITGWFLL
jgi:Rps23 Pro-64 3,4-dihydroxylase Tpa1-like proline 4-hydroxylase